MRLSAAFFALLSAALVVEASLEFDVVQNSPRKHGRNMSPAHRGLVEKRKTSAKATPTVAKRCSAKIAAEDAVSTSHHSTSTSKKASATGSSASNDNGSGLTTATSKECPDSGATKHPEKTTGPNGSIHFLDCGITSGGGWNPPDMQMSDLITVDLKQALQMPGSVFSPCEPFVDIFYKYAAQYNLEPIMLASTAMQESTCQSGAVAPGGTLGLMQITPDKCDGRGQGSCMDPDFNIGAGAKYIREMIDASGGNVLLAMGDYNGWFQGMTYHDATEAANSDCCDCQQNLDYLLQTFDGWYQGVNGNNLGYYYNLNSC